MTTDIDNERNVSGWLKQPEDNRDYNLFYYHPELLETALPDEFELTMPTKGNQLNLGSCVFWAVGRCWRFAHIKQTGQDFDLSELAAYYLARQIMGTINEDSGSYLRTGIQVFADDGAIPEAMHPYVTANFRNPPSAQALAEGQKHQALRYMTLPNTATSVKAAIYGGFPVCYGITLYQNFPQGNGNPTIPDPVGAVIGGHAMTWSGWRPNQRKTNNQWGDQWGVNGDAFMSETYALQGSDLWTIELVETDAPTPPPEPIPDEDELATLQRLMDKYYGSVSQVDINFTKHTAWYLPIRPPGA